MPIESMAESCMSMGWRPGGERPSSLSIAGTKGLIERPGMSPQVLAHVPGKLPCTSNVSSGSLHARFHGRSFVEGS